LAWSSEYDVGEKEGAQGIISALKTNNANFGISVEIGPDNPATSMAMKPATGPVMSPATSPLHTSYPLELVYSDYLTLYGSCLVVSMVWQAQRAELPGWLPLWSEIVTVAQYLLIVRVTLIALLTLLLQVVRVVSR
jgi:hypothetical protein